LHHHRIETISGTYALPRAADVSDLHWCPISSLQLWHWTPVRQRLPQEHICCKVPDIEHPWSAHQEEDYAYPLLISSNLFNGRLQAILFGRYFFLQKYGCTVIDIIRLINGGSLNRRLRTPNHFERYRYIINLFNSTISRIVVRRRWVTWPPQAQGSSDSMWERIKYFK
jgi:hypothetical protein